MTDNFNLIEKFLKFDDPDAFYFVQIIKRRKDPGNEDMRGSESVIKSYYIDNQNYYNSKKDEIIKLCSVFNARAYINLSRRSYKQVAIGTLKNAVDLIGNERYSSIKNSYNSACGMDSIENYKLVDIDQNYIEEIKAIKELIGQDRILLEIPTVSGCHLLCNGFDPSGILRSYPELDLHKNNPTLLFYNGNQLL